MKAKTKGNEGFFPVALLPIEAVGNSNRYPVPFHRAVIRLDEGKALGVHSQGYSLVTNKEMTAMFEDGFDAAGLQTKLDKEVVLDGGRKYYRVYDLADDGSFYVLTKKDEIKPQIVLSNSYDGVKPVGLEVAFVRLICTNGMVSKCILQKLYVKHTSRFTPARMGKFIMGAVDGVKAFQKGLTNLAKMKITTDLVTGLLKSGMPWRPLRGALLEAQGEGIIKIKGFDDKTEKVEMEDLKVRISKAATAYMLYNAVTAHLSHRAHLDFAARIEAQRSLSGAFGV